MKRWHHFAALAFASAVCRPRAMLLQFGGGIAHALEFRWPQRKPATGFASNTSDRLVMPLAVHPNQKRAAFRKTHIANIERHGRNSLRPHADCKKRFRLDDARLGASKAKRTNSNSPRLSFSVAALALATFRFNARTESFTHLPHAVLLIGGPSANKLPLAWQFHYGSVRRDKPFLHFPCAALPTGTQIDELVFDCGAPSNPTDELGALQSNCGGTLFLDDVDLLTTKSQHNLFAALDEQQVISPDADESAAINVRTLASVNAFLTDRDTDECVWARVPICMLAAYLIELRLLGDATDTGSLGLPEAQDF